MSAKIQLQTLNQIEVLLSRASIGTLKKVKRLVDVKPAKQENVTQSAVTDDEPDDFVKKEEAKISGKYFSLKKLRAKWTDKQSECWSNENVEHISKESERIIQAVLNERDVTEENLERLIDLGKYVYDHSVIGEAIKSRQERNDAELTKLSKAMEYYKTVLRERKRNLEESKRNLEESKKEYAELGTLYKDYRKSLRNYLNSLSEDIKEQKAAFNRTIEEFRKIADSFHSKYAERVTGRSLYNAEIMKGILGRIFPLGKISKAQMKRWVNAENPDDIDGLIYGAECLPMRWANSLKELAQASQGNRITLKSISRGHFKRLYDNGRFKGYEIGLSGDKRRCAIHELAHAMETTKYWYLPEFERVFYAKRTAGCDTQPLKDFGGNFRDDEVTRRDDFYDPYIGKYYDGGYHYEILSRGIEDLFTRPDKIAQDTEFLYFILGLIIAGTYV